MVRWHLSCPLVICRKAPSIPTRLCKWWLAQRRHSGSSSQVKEPMDCTQWQTHLIFRSSSSPRHLNACVCSPCSPSAHQATQTFSSPQMLAHTNLPQWSRSIMRLQPTSSVTLTWPADLVSGTGDGGLVTAPVSRSPGTPVGSTALTQRGSPTSCWEHRNLWVGPSPLHPPAAPGPQEGRRSQGQRGAQTTLDPYPIGSPWIQSSRRYSLSHPVRPADLPAAAPPPLSVSPHGSLRHWNTHSCESVGGALPGRADLPQARRGQQHPSNSR